MRMIFFSLLLLLVAPALESNSQNLTAQLFKKHRYEELIAHLDYLLQIRPADTLTLYNKAYVLKNMGHYADAIPLYKEVLIQDPEHAQAHYGLAQAYLACGNLRSGFYEFQWRLLDVQVWLYNLFKPNQVSGKRVLVRAEFGLGDTLQFIRYAQLLKKRGAMVYVQTFKQLVPLLQQCDFIDRIVTVDDPLPTVDYQIPLLSLPLIFKTTLDTIPNKLPYLQAKPELIQEWKKKLSSNGTFKIGICWHGKQEHFLEENPRTKRSVDLETFAPLATLPGITLYSLQKTGTDFDSSSIHFALQTFGAEFDTVHGSFMDTAALMKNLDLVISVDTSVVHLAGGLGVPTWVLIPLVPEWRWLQHRTDSPWYPTMRLFRQKKEGDWKSVIEEIVQELALLRQQKSD